MFKLIIAVATVSLLTVSVEASRNQRREIRQQGRIGQGVQSGELTRKEAKKLRKGQRHVDRLQQRASADGVVTDAEKLRIEKAQDKQSRRIYRQKNDQQERGPRPNNGAEPAVPANPNGPGEPATPAQPAEPANAG